MISVQYADPNQLRHIYAQNLVTSCHCSSLKGYFISTAFHTRLFKNQSKIIKSKAYPQTMCKTYKTHQVLKFSVLLL